MKMQNLDLKNIFEWPLGMQGVIFSLVFVLVVYFGYLLDVADLRLQLAAAKAYEQDLKLQVVSGIRKEAAISKDISRFPVLTNQLKQWQKKLIDRKDLPELLNEILKIGNRFKLNSIDNIGKERNLKISQEKFSKTYRFTPSKSFKDSIISLFSSGCILVTVPFLRFRK